MMKGWNGKHLPNGMRESKKVDILLAKQNAKMLEKMFMAYTPYIRGKER
jgi:hypothetical protein